MAEPRHEKTDVHVGLMAKLGVLIAVIAGIVVVGVLLLFRAVVSREELREAPRSSLAADPEEYRGPKLQVSPPDDLSEALAAERAVLDSYGWIDRDAGVVRIPVERAIELLDARGLPSRESAPAAGEEESPR